MSRQSLLCDRTRYSLTRKYPKIESIAKYAAIVVTHAMPKLSQNDQPDRSNGGRTRKSSKEGSTSQKTLLDNLATAWLLPLSKYSHTKASSDVSGKDATMAPQNELRFPSSATATTVDAVTASLTKYCHVGGVQA